jgi:hypothetical protein
MGFFKDVVYANIPIISQRKNYSKRNMFQGQQTGATRTRSKRTHTNELAVLLEVCLVNYKFWSFILCSNIIHKEIIKMFEREPAIGKVSPPDRACPVQCSALTINTSVFSLWGRWWCEVN